MKFVAAIDVGGTSIKSALVDEELKVITSQITDTPTEDTTGIKTVEAINEIVQNFALHESISAVGLAIPGSVDELNGKSRWAGNMRWRDLPIRDLVSAKVGLPVSFGHDVRAGGLAEFRAGAAQGFDNAIFIPIGTGISAALVIDGAIRSVDGFAGEIGHVDVGAPYDCVCGHRGCLEAVSSALAISKAYEIHTGKALSAEEISKLVVLKDPIAMQVWSDATSALAKVCELLIMILSPQVIVFGGGLAQAGALLLEPIEKEINGSITFQRIPEFRTATFGTAAGTTGAAMMAFDLINVGLR